MNRYWLKILAGALAIFGVGMVVIALSRDTVEKVQTLTQTNAGFEIPLFGLLGFRVDGARLGDIRAIAVERDAPEVVRAITVKVRADSGLPSLADCAFTFKDPHQIDENTEFLCLRDSAAIAVLQEFGEVRITGPGDATVVRRIVLPPEVIADFRRQGDGPVTAEFAERMADSLDANVDSLVAAAMEGATVDIERVRAGVRADLDRARAAVREAQAAAKAGAEAGSVTTTEAPPAPPTP